MSIRGLATKKMYSELRSHNPNLRLCVAHANTIDWLDVCSARERLHQLSINTDNSNTQTRPSRTKSDDKVCVSEIEISHVEVASVEDSPAETTVVEVVEVEEDPFEDQEEEVESDSSSDYEWDDDIFAMNDLVPYHSSYSTALAVQ